tara:strand:- start:222 stop:434 length:213 start_codon:yes stop_codon:yes gene_type:complete
MVYKFDDKKSGKRELEIEQNSGSSAALRIINNVSGNYESFQIDKTQIYDLIGCLHSIQKKIKNFKEVAND